MRYIRVMQVLQLEWGRYLLWAATDGRTKGEIALLAAAARWAGG